MDINNETCVQRVKFYFHFYEKREWRPGEEPPLDKVVRVEKVSPAAVRELGAFFNGRLERIAGMMEALLAAHADWATTGKKDLIIMETQTFDFNDALRVLKERGFTDDEFILKVEYDRKWGIL